MGDEKSKDDGIVQDKGKDSRPCNSKEVETQELEPKLKQIPPLPFPQKFKKAKVEERRANILPSLSVFISLSLWQPNSNRGQLWRWSSSPTTKVKNHGGGKALPPSPSSTAASGDCKNSSNDRSRQQHGWTSLPRRCNEAEQSSDFPFSIRSPASGDTKTGLGRRKQLRGSSGDDEVGNGDLPSQRPSRSFPSLFPAVHDTIDSCVGETLGESNWVSNYPLQDDMGDTNEEEHMEEDTSGDDEPLEAYDPLTPPPMYEALSLGDHLTSQKENIAPKVELKHLPSELSIRGSLGALLMILLA
nr:uncharacterized protein LOC109176757 [Ipomoea batatas]